MKTTNTIEIYTDGSCLGNPGPGGWAFLVLDGDEKFHEAGGDKDTTNNRMEMTAILKALLWIKKNSAYFENSGRVFEEMKFKIHSDSNLLIQTFLQGWKKKANRALWALIEDALMALGIGFKIEWIWVKAHASDKLNIEVDKLAWNEAQKQRR